MNTLYRLADMLHQSGLTNRLGWILLHSLWIDTAVAAVLAATLWMLRNSSATRRYAAGCAAMALMVALPVAVTAFVHPARDVTARPRVASPPAPVRIGPAIVPVDLAAVPSATTPATDASRLWITWAVMGWLAGVAGLSLRHLLGWAQAQRLARRGEEPLESWCRRLRELGTTLHLRVPVRLRISQRLHVPAVIGWLRPVILVPAAALTDLTPQQLESLLLHELAHVRRHDYLVNLLQTAAETLLFYHPAVWWASRVVRQERENCCDDLAADRCGSRTLYARALTAMEELRAVPGRLALAASGGTLLTRVRRVVGMPEERPDRRTPAMAAIFAITTCLLLVTFAPKLVAQEKREQSARRVDAAESRPAAEGDRIEPQDLREDRSDYRISPNDLLTITLSDVAGPNTETVRTARVTETGLISLPLIGPIKAADRTEIEMEEAITKSYRDHNLFQNMPVSVTVTEARGRAFSLMGDVQKPGEYAMVESKMRLLDALSLAGGAEGHVKSVLVVRQIGGSKPDQPKTRRIQIDGVKLMVGDPEVNIFVRPHDVIMVTAEGGSKTGRPHAVRITVTKDGLRFEGKAASWDEIAAALEKLSDHPATTIELSAASDDLTVGRLFEARAKAQELVRKYGFKELIVSGVGDATGVARKGEAAPFHVYMAGHVARPGVYEVGHDEGATLRQMLIAAGGADKDAGDDAKIHIIRRKAGGGEEFIRSTLKEVLSDGTPDMMLQADDQVMVEARQN